MINILERLLFKPVTMAVLELILGLMLTSDGISVSVVIRKCRMPAILLVQLARMKREMIDWGWVRVRRVGFIIAR